MPKKKKNPPYANKFCPPTSFFFFFFFTEINEFANPRWKRGFFPLVFPLNRSAPSPQYPSFFFFWKSFLGPLRRLLFGAHPLFQEKPFKNLFTWRSKFENPRFERKKRNSPPKKKKGGKNFLWVQKIIPETIGAPKKRNFPPNVLIFQKSFLHKQKFGKQ